MLIKKYTPRSELNTQGYKANNKASERGGRFELHFTSKKSGFISIKHFCVFL